MCFKEILKYFCCSKTNEPNEKSKSNEKSNEKSNSNSKMSIKELLNHINDDSSNEIFIEKEEINSPICKLDFSNSTIYKRRMNKDTKNNLQD